MMLDNYNHEETLKAKCRVRINTYSRRTLLQLGTLQLCCFCLRDVRNFKLTHAVSSVVKNGI